MIPVSADQRLKYLHRRLAEFTRLRLLEGSDLVSAASVTAHQLKGNCATFGMEQLLPGASLLEEGARASDLAKIRDAINLMEPLVLIEVSTMPR